MFRWTDEAGNLKPGTTIWCVGSAEGDLFVSSKSPFMIHFRVGDLPALLVALRGDRSSGRSMGCIRCLPLPLNASFADAGSCDAGR